MASNTLFPPIFEQNYMPSSVFKGAGDEWDDKTNMAIYFRLSPYNSLDQICGMLISIRLQSNNVSVARSKTQTILKRYLPGTDIREEIHKVEGEKGLYYIVVGAGDARFSTGIYYKIQLRLIGRDNEDLLKALGKIPPLADSNGAYNPAHDITLRPFLATYQDFFSEWSSVVVARKIQRPEVNLVSFKEGEQPVHLLQSNVVVMGTVNIFEQDEKLNSYRVKIFNKNENTLLEDSGDIYVNSFIKTGNVFYRSHRFFYPNVNYNILFTYVTNNGYSETFNYNFVIDDVSLGNFDATVRAEVDNAGGRIKVNIATNEMVDGGDVIVIRRTSSDTNFTVIEDIYKFSEQITSYINKTWYDYTVKSGVWYKYYIARQEYEIRTNYVTHQNPVMPNFQDIFLVAEDKQLDIRFDPAISNFTYSISQGVQETIGSKYPYIRRNGYVKYRTFPLSGTISCFMDLKYNTLSSSPTDIYGDNLSLYQNYNQQNNLNLYNNSIYQRDFRERVMDFLYKDNIKLFKSTQQGNLLVKLTNISFTPNATLGRHIYSFNCTVVQMDDYSIQNLLKYKIYTGEDLLDQEEASFEVIGQIARCPDLTQLREGSTNSDIPNLTQLGKGSTYSEADGEDIIKAIKNKYKYLESDKYKIDFKKLSYLKLYFFGKPKSYFVNNNDNDNKVRQEAQNQVFTTDIKGYSIRLTTDNNTSQDIIVPVRYYQNQFSTDSFPMGFYELTDDNASIKNITNLGGYSIFIQYRAVLGFVKKSLGMPTSYQIKNRKSQINKEFLPFESIYTKIFLKYQQSLIDDLDSPPTKTVDLEDITSLKIWAEPGTVINVKEYQDQNSFNQHIINSTGLLEFSNEETSIKDLYFSDKMYLQKIEDENKRSFKISAPVSQINPENYEHNHPFGTYIVDPLIKNFVDKEITIYLNNNPPSTDNKVEVTFEDFVDFLKINETTTQGNETEPSETQEKKEHSEWEKFKEAIGVEENTDNAKDFFQKLFDFKEKDSQQGYDAFKTSLLGFLKDRVILYLKDIVEKNHIYYFYFYNNKYYQIEYENGKYTNIIKIDNINAIIQYQCVLMEKNYKKE